MGRQRMAATGLTARAPQSARCARQWAAMYAVIWTITLATAAVVAAIGTPTTAFTIRLLGLMLTPAGTPVPTSGRFLRLAAHNIPLAAWPLLLSYTGACHGARAGRVADLLVGASLLANVLPVGAAIGAYGGALVAYIPQLPLEWAGLAVGYAAWVAQRGRPVGVRERTGWLAVITVLMVGAAMLETLAVPHR